MFHDFIILQILIENATINVVNSPDDFLTFDRLYNLKSLTLKNVEISGVKGTMSEGIANQGKKITAENITFSNNPKVTCCTAENSNEITCPCNVSIKNAAEKNVTQIVNITIFLAFIIRLF